MKCLNTICMSKEDALITSEIIVEGLMDLIKKQRIDKCTLHFQKQEDSNIILNIELNEVDD